MSDDQGERLGNDTTSAGSAQDEFVGAFPDTDNIAKRVAEQQAGVAGSSYPTGYAEPGEYSSTNGEVTLVITGEPEIVPAAEYYADAGTNVPVTGGNVSFYNEDPERAVFPTPTIGMVGLVEHLDHITTQWFKENGDVIFLIGTNKEELGGSEYLKSILGQTRGPIPSLDLPFEKKMQETLLHAIRSGLVKSAHDCSDGGLAVALAECCISNQEHQVGATVKLNDSIRPDCLLFGESQSRLIVSADQSSANDLEKIFGSAGIPISRIGSVGGSRLVIESLIDIPLARLADSFYHAMPRFMEKVG